MNTWCEQDEAITDAAVHLTLEVVRSVDYAVVRPMEIWSRTKAALSVAASSAESFSHLVSKMCEKLQIQMLSMDSAMSIRILGEQIQINGWWKRLRLLCDRDAIYIVAMAQATRALEREGKHAVKKEDENG